MNEVSILVADIIIALQGVPTGNMKAWQQLIVTGIIKYKGLPPIASALIIF